MTKLIKDKNFFQVTCEKKSISEIKSDNDEIIWLQIEGYASTKDKDRWKDIVEPNAFKSALAISDELEHIKSNWRKIVKKQCKWIKQQFQIFLK